MSEITHFGIERERKKCLRSSFVCVLSVWIFSKSQNVSHKYHPIVNKLCKRFVYHLHLKQQPKSKNKIKRSMLFVAKLKEMWCTFPFYLVFLLLLLVVLIQFHDMQTMWNFTSKRNICRCWISERLREYVTKC